MFRGLGDMQYDQSHSLLASMTEAESIRCYLSHADNLHLALFLKRTKVKTTFCLDELKRFAFSPTNTVTLGPSDLAIDHQSIFSKNSLSYRSFFSVSPFLDAVYYTQGNRIGNRIRRLKTLKLDGVRLCRGISIAT